jgi:hypothetical protein
LEIEESDVVSDRGQDAGVRNPMDVTGYVVQFKQASQEWSRAQEKEFERSKTKGQNLETDIIIHRCAFSHPLKSIRMAIYHSFLHQLGKKVSDSNA